MSETEHFTGKLTPTGKTVDEYTKDHVIPKYYNDNLEYFVGELDDTAIEIDGLVFEVQKKDFSYDDIFESTKNEDGTIDFHVKYYNGGCGFGEALGYAVNKK